MKIVKKIETIYNNVIKKYIEKNNLWKNYEVRYHNYPLQDDGTIGILINDDYIEIYIFDGIAKWLYFMFNEDGKLFKILSPSVKSYDKYKDCIYAYKRLKELSVRLV
jgi:hypothetical protein